MIIRIALILVITQLSIASPENDLCWTNEENPATSQPYSSFNEWDNDVYEWKQKFHSHFNLVSLANAFSAYSKEKIKAKSFGDDKVAHCYIGCKIAQKTNFKTSRFAAWYKELKDITDCRIESHFEIKDYDATILGAEAGKNKSTRCESICPLLIENHLHGRN